MVECETCHEKFSATQINWHRKSHAELQTSPPPPVPSATVHGKRKSAMKYILAKLLQGDYTISVSFQYRVFFKRISRALKVMQECNEQDNVKIESAKKGTKSKDDDFTVERSLNLDCGLVDEEDSERANHRHRNSNNFLISIDNNFASESEKYSWEPPEKCTTNLLKEIGHNSLFDCGKQVMSFLPKRKLSVQFKTTFGGQKDSWESMADSLLFHRLQWFSSENVFDSVHHIVCHTGGPVSALCWHPNSKYLAVSCLQDSSEEILLSKVNSRRCCIQIYELVELANGATTLDILLILGLKYGYINQLQWANYWSDEEDIFGHLACACEDSTVRICLLTTKDFCLPANFQYKEDSKDK